MSKRVWTQAQIERLRKAIHDVSSCPTCGRTIMPNETIEDHLEDEHPEDGLVR